MLLNKWRFNARGCFAPIRYIILTLISVLETLFLTVINLRSNRAELLSGHKTQLTFFVVNSFITGQECNGATLLVDLSTVDGRFRF